MKKKIRILALDGGGIRGIIPATILRYVEDELVRKTGNPDARIIDYFDLVAGTSTGGILACIYLAPPAPESTLPTRYTASEALDFYVKEGYNIFNGSKISSWKRLWGLRNATEFDPGYLENLFLNRFGNLKMSQLLKPCIVTTYNMRTKSSYFFNSMEPDELKREFYVRDVARSTSAAPTYFPPAMITNLITQEPMVNIDGGVFANNPSMCAYAEARNTNFVTHGVDCPSADDMLILSIGTGGGGFTLPDLQSSGRWSVLKWAKSIPEIMMDGSIDTVAFQMNEIFGTLEKEEDQMCFKRIDVPQNGRIYAADMSDASPENIQKLLQAGEITLEAAKKGGKGHTLDSFIDLLIAQGTVANANS